VNQLRLVVVFVAAMAAQWWWSTHLAMAGVAPQLLLVLTVATAARYGSLWAMSCGFFWGLFLDVLGARLFGANALALTLVGYVTGSVRRQIDVAGLAPQCLLAFAMTWAYFILLGLLGTVFTKSFLWVGWPVFLFDPIYNCLITAVIFVAWAPPRWDHHR
jgi:rod shape-determining protein MreD